MHHSHLHPLNTQTLPHQPTLPPCHTLRCHSGGPPVPSRHRSGRSWGRRRLLRRRLPPLRSLRWPTWWWDLVVARRSRSAEDSHPCPWLWTGELANGLLMNNWNFWILYFYLFIYFLVICLRAVVPSETLEVIQIFINAGNWKESAIRLQLWYNH